MNETTNFFSHFFKDFEKGANPIAGQIFGLLLLKSDPISLAEIAAELELSKAAISIHIRYLNDLGYCVKLPRKKDRKDYYQINEFFVSQILRNRIRQMELYSEELKRISVSITKETNTENRNLSKVESYFDEIISFQKKMLSDLED